MIFESATTEAFSRATQSVEYHLEEDWLHLTTFSFTDDTEVPLS